MKKLLTILLSTAIVCSSFAFVAACDGGQEEEIGEIVTVYDFEKTGLLGVRMHEAFGKIELNEDETYVKSGVRSAKLMPSSERSREPYMYFPFESNALGFNYRKTSEISEVSVDLYTEEETTVNVGMYFSSGAELKSTPDSFKLFRGWNTVTYVPSYSVISVQYKLTDFYGVYLSFDATEKEPPVVYVDDVRFKKEEIAVEAEDLIVLKRTGDYAEICDFEKAYQSLVFAPYGGSSSASAPDLRVVKASDYGLTAASGEKMLRIELFAATGSGGAWTQIDMVSALLEKVNFPQYVGKESEYELKLDFYQPETTETPLLFELNPYYDSNNQNWSGLTSKKGQWIHFSKPLTNFENFLASPVRFAFAWMNPKEEGEYVYYLDNIRIEKIKG